MPDDREKRQRKLNERLRDEFNRTSQNLNRSLRQPLIKGKARRSKKLKVSGAQGAKGLVGLI